MTPENPSLEAVMREVENSGIADHQLVRLISDGGLDRDALRVFATRFHHLMAMFPKGLGTAISVTDDAPARKMFIDALTDIDASPGSTTDLWLRVCAAIGLFSDSVKANIPNAETSECVSEWFKTCSTSPAHAAGALYAVATLLRRWCRVWGPAFVEHHNVSSGHATEFFDRFGNGASCIQIDLARALETVTGTSELNADAAEGASRILSAMKQLLDSTMLECTVSQQHQSLT